MRRGETLAQNCAGAGVLANQLGMVLAHLTRHRRPEATRQLLAALLTSPFARRSKRTRQQLENLERYVKTALANVSDWRQAAVIVGWAKRLWPVYKKTTQW